MTINQTLLLCALLIVSAILGANIIRPAAAQGGGPYMLMQHSNPAANAGVFRIDTSSGGVSYCFITNGNDLVCSKEVK